MYLGFIKIKKLKGRSKVRRAFALLSVFLVSQLNSTNLLAQSARPSLIVNAQPIESSKLPFPGQPITLSAEVINTRDFRPSARLLAVRDGKFYEIAAQPGLLGINDRPQYKVELPAPLAELIYQFVVLLPDGSVVSSQRTSVRRGCIPNITPAQGEIPEEVDGSEKFKLLLSENKRLELEINNTDRAVKLADEISGLIAQ